MNLSKNTTRAHTLASRQGGKGQLSCRKLWPVGNFSFFVLNFLLKNKIRGMQIPHCRKFRVTFYAGDGRLRTSRRKAPRCTRRKLWVMTCAVATSGGGVKLRSCIVSTQQFGADSVRASGEKWIISAKLFTDGARAEHHYCTAHGLGAQRRRGVDK